MQMLQYPLTWVFIGIVLMGIVMYFAQGFIVLIGGTILGMYLYQIQNKISTPNDKTTEIKTIFGDYDIKQYLQPSFLKNIFSTANNKLTESFCDTNKNKRWWHTS